MAKKKKKAVSKRKAARQKKVDGWVKDLEGRIGKLPKDYTQFIRKEDFSQVPGPCGVEFNVEEKLTPFGAGGVMDFFVDPDPDEMGYFEDAMMLEIGSNGFGYPVCMSLGKDRGSVYYYDIQQRVFWDDEQFHMMFSNLASSIENWMARRRAGKLPKKEEGRESFYKVASSFSEFLERCTQIPEG